MTHMMHVTHVMHMMQVDHVIDASHVKHTHVMHTTHVVDLMLMHIRVWRSHCVAADASLHRQAWQLAAKLC